MYAFPTRSFIPVHLFRCHSTSPLSNFETIGQTTIVSSTIVLVMQESTEEQAESADRPLCLCLMMHSMGRDPENWPPFQSQRGAYGQNIFHPLRGLVAAMREKPMVPYANAEAASDPPQHHCEQQCRPTEYEQCSYSAYVKYHHEEGSHPHDGLSSVRLVLPSY